MEKIFLKVYQIYFDEAQIPQLEYIPYHNEQCTVYFESSVMKDLIEAGAHLDSEYFGIVSYQLHEKVGIAKTQWKNIQNIANHSLNKFSKELFEFILNREKPDVMSFQKHLPHDPVTFANQFHPNFSRHFQKIMQKIGYNWVPTHLDHVFYCNYFAAKSEIYAKFVHEMLIPAMKIMEMMPELYQNSKYPKILPENLQKSFGISHYPYHAFLCERMFSYFVHLNKYKCLHY